MKDSITTIHIPDSPMNAVFWTEYGIRKKLCLLAGIQRVNDDNTTTVLAEAMIYREDKKAYFRASEAAGFIGLEFADHPQDWSSRVHDYEQQHNAMEREAANIVHTIERERASINGEQRRPAAPLAPPPMPSSRRVVPPPPETLPDGSQWKDAPAPQLKPEEIPAAPRLTEQQQRSRLFKW